VIEGKIRKHDCGQITDGAACIFLANEEVAKEYAHKRGMRLEDIPHVRGTITDAFKRANIKGPDALDGIETHDCFTSTEYMAIDHFGITAPGESWKAIESGEIAMGGKIPINASGGLIGLGHPVGTTGVRMLLDSYKQVTETAGDYQIEGAANVATLNIGGSATTTVSFIIGK